MRRMTQGIAVLLGFAVAMAGALPEMSSAQTAKTLFGTKKKATPGCYWSDEKEEEVCITAPRKPPPPYVIPRVTKGGGCGTSGACGGNKREFDPQNLPDARGAILTIEPGTLTRAGRIQTLTRSSGNR
jgi:hypothetical protein